MAKVSAMPKAAKQPAVDAPPKDVPTLKLDALVLRENAQNIWCVVALKGVAVEDLESAELWTVVAQRLRGFDLIRVVAHDRSWWAELLVLDAIPGRAEVKTIRSVALDGLTIAPELQARIPKNHRIELGAPDVGWVIFRDNPDGTVTIMAEGCDQSFWSFERALSWITNHATLRQSMPTS